MNRSIARLTSAAAAVAVTAVGAVILTPGSALAAAATKCSSVQKNEWDTIGPDLDLAVQLCVTRNSSNDYRAYADISWNDGGGGVSAGMEDLILNLRLERNDADYRNEDFNINSPIRVNESGSTRVYGSTYRSSTTGGWTADGHVEWDIQNDGKGGDTWPLGGSPSI
ncbi:hypothetical protein OG985_36205 [Streptomyces sp. NBC_00289]|uniref:hypothetical protein n=1 Tax=Streptomyces sp. NBC_00289 TaxID=2975703 RepID=UPI00324911C2